MPRSPSAPRLLDAAEALLVEGAGDLEMRAVGRRAGLSEGLAYHHYRNKAGLVSAVVARFFDRYEAVLNRHRDRDRPWAERERERLEELVDFLYGEPLARVVFGNLARLPESAAAEGERRRALVLRAAHNIRSGQAQGALPGTLDAELAGAAIIGAVNEVVGWSFAQTTPPPKQAVVEALWRTIAGAVGLELQED